MRFGQIMQFLNAASQPHSENLPATERDQRMRKLVTFSKRIGLIPDSNTQKSVLSAMATENHHTENAHQRRRDTAKPDTVETAQKKNAHGNTDNDA